jgi:hypothetical protein
VYVYTFGTMVKIWSSEKHCMKSLFWQYWGLKSGSYACYEGASITEPHALSPNYASINVTVFLGSVLIMLQWSGWRSLVLDPYNIQNCKSLFFKIIHLFTCAYIVWVISPSVPFHWRENSNILHSSFQKDQVNLYKSKVHILVFQVSLINKIFHWFMWKFSHIIK